MSHPSCLSACLPASAPRSASLRSVIRNIGSLILLQLGGLACRPVLSTMQQPTLAPRPNPLVRKQLFLLINCSLLLASFPLWPVLQSSNVMSPPSFELATPQPQRPADLSLPSHFPFLFLARQSTPALLLPECSPSAMSDCLNMTSLHLASAPWSLDCSAPHAGSMTP